MLLNADLNNKYQTEVANTAIYLKNRNPTAVVRGVLSEEKQTGKKWISPISEFLIILHMYMQQIKKRKKFDPKSCKYMIIKSSAKILKTIG